MGSPLHYDAVIETAGWTNSLTRMERQMFGLTSTVVNQSNLIDQQFARIGKLAAGYLSFQSLAGLPAQIARVRGEFQSLEISYRTLLGNKEKADELLAKSTKLAAKTPFSLREVGQGAKQLLAYGFSAEQVIPTLNKLGDISAGTGDQLNHLLYIYGTLKSQGRAYARDIMQFTAAGVPLLSSLSDVLGVSVDKVNELVSAGKVGFPQVEQAINALTKSGSMFGGLQEAQSKSITGLISNLGDAYDRVLNDIGKANEGIISDSIKGATGLLENYQQVIDILKVLVATYGTYKAALVLADVAQSAHIIITETMAVQESLAALAGETLTASQLRQAAAASLLSRAQATLNAVLLANPYVIVATALAALLTAYFVFREEVTEIKNAQQILAESGKDVSAKFREQSSEVKLLVGVIKNQNIAESERIKAYDRLKQIAPDIVQGLDFQKAKTADLTKATNEYLVSLEKKIRLESASAGLKTALEQDVDAAEKLKNAQDELLRKAQVAKNAGASSVLSGPDARGGGLGAKLDLDAAQRNLDAAVEAKQKTAKAVGDIEASVSKIYSGGTKDGINAEISRLELVRSTLKDKLSPAYKDVEDKLKDLTTQRDKLTAADAGGQKAVVKTVAYYDEQIKKLKEQQEQASSPAQFQGFKTQIDNLVKQRNRLTGEMTAAEKKAIKDADKIGPFGSLSYWENISKKAQEVIDKTPGSDTAKLAKQVQVRNEADAKAEEIRKRTAVKSFEDELAEKRTRYELFQKYIDTYGQTAADAQFSELRQSGQTYVDYLNDQIRLLEEKRQSGLLTDKESANLGNLLTERSDATGQKSAIDAFRESLTKAKDEASSLTDYLTVLQQKQAALNPNDESKTGIDKRQQLAEELTATQRELQGQLTQFLQSFASSSEQQLAIQRSFADKRTAVERRYNGQRTAEYKAAMAQINTAEAEELQALQRRKLEESDAYKQTTKVILEEGQKGLAIQIANQRQVVEAARQIGGANSEVFKQEQQKLNQLTKQYSSNQIGEFNQYAQLVGEFGQALSELGGDAARTGSNLTAFAGAAQQLSGVFKEGLSTTELYQAGIQGIITVLSAVASAAAQRKQAETDYYNSLIAQQQQYNLLLNEQIGLRAKSQSNVFVRDFMGELNDGFAKYDNARAKYEESLKKLSEGRAKSGLKSEIDGATALKTIGGAAATGAAIGSIIPGLGTAVGAVGGAIVGGLISLFGGAKKKADEFKGLLEQYPDLIQKGADGVEEINTALAQSLIQQGLVDDATKGLIQTTLDWQKQMDEAKEAIKGIVSELAGNLGNALSDSLTNAFKNGESAAEAFKSAVEKVLDDLVAKILFQKAFGKLFDKLEEDLSNSLGPGGDGAVIDDFQRFTENSKEATELYNQWLASFQQAAKASGFDVLQPTNGGGVTKANTSLSGAVKGVSEETAGVLAGQISAIRISQAQATQTMNSQLVALNKIEVNTRTLSTIDRSLQSIDDGIRQLNRDPLRSKGG